MCKRFCRSAPSEDRTHDLQIMRLTRCLLRYRGGCWSQLDVYVDTIVISHVHFWSCRRRIIQNASMQPGAHPQRKHTIIDTILPNFPN